MALVYVVPGDLVGREAVNLGVALKELTKTPNDIVLDMSNVREIDCSGLGVIAHLRKRLRGHTVRLRDTRPEVAEQLEEMGVMDLLQPKPVASRRRFRSVFGSHAVTEASA